MRMAKFQKRVCLNRFVLMSPVPKSEGVDASVHEHLLCKHEDLNWNPQQPWQCEAGIVAHWKILSLRRQRQEDPWGKQWFKEIKSMSNV